MKRYISIFLILILLSGCATTRRYEFGTKSLTQDNINRIARGITTQADILSMFGEPLSKTNMSTLGIMWTYSYSRSNAIYGPIGGVDRDMQVCTLCVTFDDKGIVKDFTSSEANPIQKGTFTIMRGSHK